MKYRMVTGFIVFCDNGNITRVFDVMNGFYTHLAA